MAKNKFRRAIIARKMLENQKKKLKMDMRFNH